MEISFNNKLRQVSFLVLIIVLGVLLFRQLQSFVPGFLGGITLFIISREPYYKLIFAKKWKKGWTALLFMIICIIVVALPIFFTVKMISPRINDLINNQDQVIEGIKTISHSLSKYTGVELVTTEKIQSTVGQVASYIPSVLNSTLNLITNLIMMFFLFYYLLVCGRDVEKTLRQFIPLKAESIDELAKETKVLVKANALGIPLISFVQGIVAALGYWVFGIEDWGMWGFVTGVFAFFPIVGTMIVWVPLVIYMYATGDSVMATGLLLYSVIVTGNIDYVTRMGLMKKLGDVHPMITVLGVIVGLNLFGFIGLIFGPLLLSYFLIFTKIYIKEFSANSAQELDNEQVDSTSKQ